MVKISVIVPVYKAEAYLRDCVDSILAQTFSDIEIILVNDGSPDNSGAICNEYAARESRVSVIHQSNQGQAAARNHALAQAKGEWISFVDSDDLIHPQMLELLYDAVRETGAGISMCEMLEAVELPQDFCRPQEMDYQVLTVDEETLVRLHDENAYPAWVGCAKLIRKEIIENYPFREGRVYEDNEAVCRWVCQAGKLAKFDHEMYFYRTNPESTTKSTFSLKRLDYLWALESILRFYDSLGWMQMRQRFFERYVDAAASACYGLRHGLGKPELTSKISATARKLFRELGLKLNRDQFELLLDAAHPKLVKFYWYYAGAMKRIQKLWTKG